MFSKAIAFVAASAFLPSALAGAILPRRDTPNFYLVAVTNDPTYHLQTLKVNEYSASLASGTPVKAYLEGGMLMVDDAPLLHAVAGFTIGPNGSCTPDGNLIFPPSNTANKCARSSTFGLASYELNAQLGSKLTYDLDYPLGGFYVCSSGNVRVSPIARPGCTPVNFWTVPVN